MKKSRHQREPQSTKLFMIVTDFCSLQLRHFVEKSLSSFRHHLFTSSPSLSSLPFRTSLASISRINAVPSPVLFSISTSFFDLVKTIFYIPFTLITCLFLILCFTSSYEIPFLSSSFSIYISMLLFYCPSLI